MSTYDKQVIGTLAAIAAIVLGILLILTLLFIWNIWIGLVALALTLIIGGAITVATINDL